MIVPLCVPTLPVRRTTAHTTPLRSEERARIASTVEFLSLSLKLCSAGRLPHRIARPTEANSPARFFVRALRFAR